MEQVTTKQVQTRLLEVFKFVQKFLSDNGLRYVACGGTILGAVRHKGFIPWDDDIDIYMPREDYNRLMLMNDKLRPLGYEFISCLDKGYYMPFAKISDLNSTIWEFKRLPFIMGLYVDIFPVDEFDEPDDVITAYQRKSHFYFDKYINAVSQYPVSHFFNSLFRGDIHQMGLYVLNLYRSRRQEHYLKAFLDFENNVIGRKGEKCVSLSISEGRIMKSDWFKDVVELPFEDTTVIVPRDYDGYLSKIYGNYMQLPPEEKRVTHPHYFIDLNKRYTIEEIKGLLK